jgi:glycerol uptake facilitator-like aquaporin
MLNNKSYISDSNIIGGDFSYTNHGTDKMSISSTQSGYLNNLSDDGSSYNSGIDENLEYIIDMNNDNLQDKKMYNMKVLFKETISEFIGMYIYIIISTSINSQVIIYGLSGGDISFIYWFYISVGRGISLIFGMYVALLGNSDGYLNPSILLSIFLLNKISVNKLVCYTLTYVIASFFAASSIYLLNINELSKYNNTLNIFASRKVDSITSYSGFFMEIVITIIYTFIYLCINNNKKNNEKYCKFIGLLLISLSLGFGYNTQMAINPAYDIGSRLVTLFGPSDKNIFLYNNWFWVPVIAPYIGSLFGFGIFYLYNKIINFQL